MTDTIPELTGERALELLREVVAERPNRVVKKCTYVHAGRPQCLVGAVLHRHGVPLDVLADCEGILADGLATDAGLPLSPSAARILDIAQVVQDGRRPWREALTAAEKRASELWVAS